MVKIDCKNCLLGLSLVLLLTSCFKEEPMNMECDILEAWVGEENLTYFYNKADMRISDVPSDEQKLEFTVRSRATLPQLALHFTLSPGATITPANGSLQDFSKEAVTYTVTSEDGQWKKQYTVNFTNPIIVEPDSTEDGKVILRYDFEHYRLDEKGKYYVWYEVASDGSENYPWASGNAGYTYARPNAKFDAYPTVPDPNGYEGSCVKLTTCDTGSWGKMVQKPIAAGNLFLGNFNSTYAMTNTLKTTEMGLPFMQEPLKVTGYYKYIPGDVFTDKDKTVVAGRVDEPSIYAVFYRNQDADGNSIVLHGDDVMTSPYIVSIAQATSLPSTTEWKMFEMTFDQHKAVDQSVLENRGYNLAMVFSSSKTGDKFEGAVGSTLYVDKVNITFIGK